MTDSTNPRVMADNIRKLDARTNEIDARSLETESGLEAIGTYSTTEVETGMTYKGDPIFRKIFEIDNLPNNTTLTIAHGVTNLGKVIELRAIAQGESSGFPIDYRNQASLTFSTTQIGLTAFTDFSEFAGRVFFEYTKAATP